MSVTEITDLEQILSQVQRLSPESRLRLIQRVAEMMLPELPKIVSRRLIYGEFQNTGREMSTEEDFE